MIINRNKWEKKGKEVTAKYVENTMRTVLL